MKTMKAKIIGLIVSITLLLCGILGVMNVFLNIATAEDVLEQNLIETAMLASARIEKELEVTKTIAIQTGCLPQLSGDLPVKEKDEIFQQVIKNNGYLGGNLLGTDGVSILDGSDIYKDRDYFLSAVNGEAFISGPTVSRITGLYSVLISAPVWKDGKAGTDIVGVLYLKPDINMFSGIVSTIDIGQTGGAYIIDKEGMVMAHSDESLVFQFNANEAVNDEPSLAKIAQIEQEMMAGNTGYDTYEKNGAAWVQAYAPISGTDGWCVGVYAKKDEFLGSVRTAILLTVCVSVLFLIVGAIIALIFTKKVLKPVNVAAVSLTKMAKGERVEALDEDKFKGEFRPIAKSFNELQATLKKLLEDTEMLAGAVMHGDLSVRADETAHKGRYRALVEAINETINTFVSDFDAVPSPIMAIDKEFTIHYMNEAGAKVSGKSKEELIGKKCYDVFCTGDCKTENCACMQAMQDKQQHEHETEAHPAGADMEIRYMGTPLINDGEVVGAFEVVTDLTVVKKAQREAQDQADMLTALLNDVNVAAEQVAVGARQVSDGSQAISQGAMEQASAIEELTATVTQIAGQTRQNASSAGKANEFTTNAKQGAAEGNAQMKGMQQAMGEINEASASISKIIKVIDDIAFQTNILALNAAVEAARAGVHGKGFAVVAEEVRNLAARSANAAKETTTLIEGSIRKTEAGTEIANKTAAALAGIVEGVEKAAELTGQIAVASDEQATGITQVNNGIEQLSQVVQTNSATSEETAASAEELSSQAELLKNMVGRFKAAEGPKTGRPETGKPEPKEQDAPAQAKPRIALNDSEFGKY